MTHTLTELENLISEAESRKKFLEQGVEALQETLNEANAELQRLKVSAEVLTRPSADPTKTTDKTIVKDGSIMTERQFTEKEQTVIQSFEQARPGLGEIAKANILNPNSDWADQIEQMPKEELIAQTAFVPNSFSYRHIGH